MTAMFLTTTVVGLTVVASGAVTMCRNWRRTSLFTAGATLWLAGLAVVVYGAAAFPPHNL